ncbi:peptide-methionine (S)-S-oxide reductase MsrA [Spirosoma rhododendri]|uniref:Peptide methionine sulfoxide reductase MsrA n=1 Tax=Spirosoma rhododendri TaxID=2728024 RepID=A0A7L5DSF5_9BACT|nr:peptide-methionine (S)-S-oxide reductase MsrA [Spirosoma rhododendri]QJD80542.1 peptide-methionine (S)-S-oxide reductase MsrA [Spirosoma rhododendri]
MKKRTKTSLFAALTVLLLGCSMGQAPDNRPAKLPALKPGEVVATFAGGCFWATEEAFDRLKGVNEVVSGYAGSDYPSPTYADVSTDQTDHAESVQVYYDPKQISYGQLLTAFFAAHDPTTLNKQGPDVGKHYRSMAFYRTESEHRQLVNAIQKLDKSGQFKDPVVTEVVPFKAFYPAEGYHQNYCKAHPWQLYIQTVSMPKIHHMEKAMDGQLKAE